MEAVTINKNFTSALNIDEALAAFFKAHSPEDIQVLFWKFFKCWVRRDCDIEVELTNEEVALFFDQLMDLVAAAYILHQANGALENKQEGEGHE